MSVSGRGLIRVGLVTGALLSIPLIAMQLGGEVNWTAFDFVVAGILLGGTGLLFELAVRGNATGAHRLAVGAALGTGLFLVWSNLAVGLIGSETHPVNRMYFGVVGVALIGGIVTRLEPHRMARVLFATALAQCVVPVIALGLQVVPADVDLFEVLGVTAFFSLLWIASALLFFRASRAAAIGR